MTTIDDQHAAVAALTRFATIPGWLAAGMQPERVAISLRRHIPDLARKSPRLVSVRPDRLRAKGGEWLARYTATVQYPGEDPRDVVLVGNLWGPGQELPTTATALFGTAPGAAFGEPGWGCLLPDLRLQLRVQPSDEALPALPRLVEPTAVAQLLEPVLQRAGYRGARISSCEPEVVRYKPGSRCTIVVRVRYADGAGAPELPNPVVLKTHQGDKGVSAWAAMTALWERQADWRWGVTLAEPLAYLPEERILVQGPVPEEATLKELAREAIGTRSPAQLARLRDELERTARALAALHWSGATYGRTATYDDELAEVAEVVDRLSLSVPELDAAAQPLLERLTALSHRVPADPVVPAHHDFRPAQVLLDHGRIGFIDFDGACMAEPALDVGRFRAKLRDIGISTLPQGNDRARPGVPQARGATPAEVAENLALLDELCEHFLSAYLRHRTISTTRVLMWEACDLLTTMLHAWTKVRLARLQPRMTVLVHHLRTSGLLDLAP